MKKISLMIISLSFFVFTSISYAACPSDLNNNCGASCPEANCIPNSALGVCICNSNSGGNSGGGGSGSTIEGIGKIENPIKTGTISDAPGAGLIALLNNVLRLIFVVAGIYSLVQIVLAGFGFISAGADPKAIEKSWNTIWQSMLGLVIIVGSLALAALLGLLLFGDAGAILNPKIYGPN